MNLFTSRCEIRSFTPDQADLLYPLLSDPRVMAHLEPPYSRDQARSFLLRAGLSDPPLIHAIWGRGNGKLLGYLIFHPFGQGDWELGWVLFPQYWGIGIARELTRELISYAEAQGLTGLVLECSPEQTTTRKIARHFGFHPAGEQDRLMRFRLPL